MPEQLARDIDGAASKYKFKGTIPGIKGYSRMSGAIDWLETAGLVNRVPIVSKAALPLSAYCKENTFKLYLFDTGILSTLSGLSPDVTLQYSYGTYKGYIAENIVAQLLLASEQEKLFAWKEKESELEFVLAVDNSIIPVEVKSGRNTRSRSLAVYSQKYSPPQSIILSSKYPQLNSQPLLFPLYSAEFIPTALIKSQLK